MLDVAPTELLLVALVALVVIGPKDLPRALRLFGRWIGRAQGMIRRVRLGFDDIVREAELAEMKRNWAEENARILREHAPVPAAPHSAEGDRAALTVAPVHSDSVAVAPPRPA